MGKRKAMSAVVSEVFAAIEEPKIEVIAESTPSEKEEQFHLIGEDGVSIRLERGEGKRGLRRIICRECAEQFLVSLRNDLVVHVSASGQWCHKTVSELNIKDVVLLEDLMHIGFEVLGFAESVSDYKDIDDSHKLFSSF